MKICRIPYKNVWLTGVRNLPINYMCPRPLDPPLGPYSVPLNVGSKIDFTYVITFQFVLTTTEQRTPFLIHGSRMYAQIVNVYRVVFQFVYLLLAWVNREKIA